MLEHAQRLGDPSTGSQYPCGTGKAATVWATCPSARSAA